VRFYPQWNHPDVIKVINDNDLKDLRLLEKGDVVLPVSIGDAGVKGRGLFATRDIEKG